MSKVLLQLVLGIVVFYICVKYCIKLYVNWVPVNYSNNVLNNRIPLPLSSSSSSSPPDIPKIIHLTYHDKSNIPQKVYDNLQQYANGYTVYIYDDADGTDIIKKYYTHQVAEKYERLTGAHKADLLRYCLLYIYGGVYMDIKTELILPLSEVFSRPFTTSVLSSYTKETIYQGVIATRPQNPLFLDLINYIVQKPLLLPQTNYLAFVKDFYDQVRNDVGCDLVPGINVGKKDVYYLLEEKCSHHASECYDGLDRYGLCCFIYDHMGRKVIKTRYADYPWEKNFHSFWKDSLLFVRLSSELKILVPNSISIV